MRLQFLGTGGFHPNERRHTAGLLFPDLGLAFDAGSCSFRMTSRLTTPDLEIFLTHAHLDHIQGLTVLLVPLLLGSIRKCRVHADPVVIEAVKTHLFSDPIFPVLPSFEFVVLEERVLVGNGRGTITHCPLKHPGGSLGFKLELDGHRMAYITDTCVDGTYTEFIRGVDVLIHECYFPDSMSEWAAKTGHSHTTPVAQLARDAGVGRLYLTHIDPQRSDDDPVGLAAARAVFTQTYLAEDLLEVEV